MSEVAAIAAALTAETRARQGLPPTIVDPTVLAKVAAVVAAAGGGRRG